MGYEDILNDKTIGFDRKIPTLVEFWKQLRNLIRNNQSKPKWHRILELAQTHTLNLVLHGDWALQSEELKDSLYTVVVECDDYLSKCETLISRRCKKLIEVVRDPWGNSTLCKILNNPDRCSKEEELAYFSSEHGYFVAMRLKKLCDSHCEDLALRFANACLRCLRLPESQDFLVVTTSDQKRYILDIYIALLHKYKRTHDIINELKHLSLNEGLQLVQRFIHKRVEVSRVWKHSSRIAELAAQFFMAAAMTKPVKEIGSVLTELLDAWVVLNDKLDGIEAIPTIIRRIIQTADSASHIYICCQVLNKQFGDKIKSFTIELYIRALTTDMNEMEKQKAHSEHEKVEETSKRLSEQFLSLADLLQEHLGVSRECVLTSFSLNPTRYCMERIENLAIACGKISSTNLNENINNSNKSDLAFNDSKETSNHLNDSDSGNLSANSSYLNLKDNLALLDTGQYSSSMSSSDFDSSSCTPTTPPTTTSPTKDRMLDALILIKGDAVTGSKNYDVLSAPNQVLDAKALGLSEQLCDDLAVVLSSPRYQLLSWVLDWNELKSACDRYLSNAKGTRNIVKELKYLNIDYNQFKDWPTDEERQQYGGIEKGYEQWADEDNSTTGSVSDYHLTYVQSNDSDCSSSALRGRRRRKTTRRIYSSESEYDSVERKVDSHGSDMDTASQDADSLGSDGLQHLSTQLGNKNTKKKTSLSQLAMIMNAHHAQGRTHNQSNNDDMMSVFAPLNETNNNNKPTTISRPSYLNPTLQPFLLPEKRNSDPQVLRSLRMYRTKKRDKEEIRSLKSINNNNNNSSKDEIDSTESKIAKLTKLPHYMNPRVLLDRQDFNNFLNKDNIKMDINSDLDSILFKSNRESSENKPMHNNCNNFHKTTMDPYVKLDRYEDIQNVYKKNKNSLNKKSLISSNFRERKRRRLDVLADVPGLNTLDMIRPALVQSTVQVVQLSTNQISNQQIRTVKSQASSSSNATSSVSSSITSTPVTAHIQRIGQPRSQDTTKVSRTSDTDNTSSAVSVSLNCTNETQTLPISSTLTTSMNASSSASNSTSTSTSTSISTSTPPTSISVSDTLAINTTTVTLADTQKTASSSQNSTVAAAAAAANAASTTTPTLVNILSQQIIRPAQANTPVSNRSPTLINILSQQIIRPPLSQSVPIVCVSTAGIQNTVLSNTTTVTTTVTQAQNCVKLVTTNSSQQIIQQLFNSQGKNNNQVLKNVNLVAGIANTQSTVDTSRLVQFLCKTDGKMIQLTPYSTNANIKLQTIESSSKLVKPTPAPLPVPVPTSTPATTSVVSSAAAATTAAAVSSGGKQQTNTQQPPVSPSCVSPPISVRSDYEENYAKFIQTSGKKMTTKNIKETSSTNEGEGEGGGVGVGTGGTSEQTANSLPKFQQAFGKSVYQSNTSSVDQTSTLSTVGISSSSSSTNSVNIHGNALVTSTQTNLTTTSTNSINVTPHLQLTNSSLISKSNSGGNVQTAAAAAVTAIPVIGTNKSTVVHPLGVQTIPGSVIYTRQVPVSLAVTAAAGQTINLISNATATQSGISRNQVFRITSASADQMNIVKDTTVIRSKMNAFLAAALQSGVPNRCVPSNIVSAVTSSNSTTTTVGSSPSSNTETTNTSQNQLESMVVDADVCEVDSSSNDSCHTNTNTSTTTSTLVTPMRITLPMMQRTPGPNGMQGTTTRIVRPVLQIPGTMIRGATAVRQQVVLASASAQPVLPIASSSAARTQAQPVSISSENLITHNSMEPLVSSTTLEQLREFDLVLEQIKERSIVQPTTSASVQTSAARPPQVQTQAQTQQAQAQTSIEKQQQQQTTSSNVINQTSDLQEVISSSGVSVSYMNQSPQVTTQKVSPCTSVVVVTSYCNIQPAASPALSVTSQSSSSPCVTPAPSSSGSIGKTVPKATAKSPKSKTVKTTTTHASKASPVPKPQQKPQEDEQTTQRIFDILAEYAEQLRNSPDLNNKPAPRRRSNPPTNPSQNSKRKKNSGQKKAVSSHCNSMASDLSPGTEDPRTIGSEDSSCGVVQISVQDSPSQGAPSVDEHQSAQGSSDFSSIRTQQTETSNSETEIIEQQLPTSGRQFIFTDSNTNQSRNVIIADSTVNETLGKISNTAAVIVPANYIAVVSGNSKILATVPTRSGSNMLLFQGFVNQARKPVGVGGGQSNIKPIKYSTIQPIQGISSQTLSGVSAQPPVVLPSGTDTSTLTQQTLSLKSTTNTTTTTTTTEHSSTATDNQTIPPTNDLLLNVNVGSANDVVVPPTITQQIMKMKEASHQSTSSMTTCENGVVAVESVVTQLDHSSMKVMPMCSDTISSDDVDTKSISDKLQNNSPPLTQNASFSLNFTTKPSSSVSVLEQAVTRSPVIEKNINIIQDSCSIKKLSIPGLPSLGEKIQHTVVRTVIEAQPTAKNLATSGDITFTQMECTTSVDHFTKVYAGEKKTQSNSNGPMLGQSDSNVSRDVIIAEPNKENVHEKVPGELEDTGSITTAFTKQKKIQTTQRVVKELEQLHQRKQAALERELHLQKSLSEECEDLGVDEPSTSDLFPEADLLFDSNNSPSYDQLSQDADKRYSSNNFQMESSCSSNEDGLKKSTSETNTKSDRELNNSFLIELHGTNTTGSNEKEDETGTVLNASSCTSCQGEAEVDDHEMEGDAISAVSMSEKRDTILTTCTSESISTLDAAANTGAHDKEKEPTITLFSDEDDSNSTLRTDLLFGNLDYPSAEVEFDYDERPTIRRNCSTDGITLQSSTSNYSTASYDDHTLLTTCTSIMEVCSPIHYDIGSESPRPKHKYIYQYCNKKKMMNKQITPIFQAPDVIEVLSSNDESSASNTSASDTSESDGTPEQKSSAGSSSGSPSPTSSDRKRGRATSPAWDEDDENDDDEDDDDDDDDNDDDDDDDDGDGTNGPSNYKSIYNTNKILKLSVGNLVEPITCANQHDQKPVAKMKMKECTLDSSVVNTTPPSPLSPADGELGSFAVSRGTRRSTQRLKKNCPCCTSPEKPKKRPPGAIKKITKGQFTKKR